MKIYAEISRALKENIENKQEQWTLPDGVELQRNSGSRACFFDCDDATAAKDLIDFLDDKGITWQIIVEENKGENKRREKSYEKGFREMSDPWNNKAEQKGFKEMRDPWNNSDEDN